MRTGCEILLFAVRSEIDHYNRPIVVASSPRVSNFFKMCFNQLPTQWVFNLEAFCLTGLDGNIPFRTRQDIRLTLIAKYSAQDEIP